MILQTVVVKDAHSFPPDALCYRCKDIEPIIQQDAVDCPKGCEISFDTYLNSLSIEKWMKYTNIHDVTLHLALRGHFFIRLFQLSKRNGSIERHLLSEHEAASEDINALALPVLPKSPQGLIYFSITAHSENAHFVSARYEACVENPNPVKLALDICTYRREKYVYDNMYLINNSIWQNPNSPLKHHMEVFVSDNGRTLEPEKLVDLPVHLLPNKNTGGAGGFARGMVEILDHPNHFTHVVIMDDDVRILPEALERLYAFLRALKPEFANRTIAGAMLRLESQKSYIQQEAAGQWLQTRTEPIKAELDLRSIDHIFENEQEEPCDYNAWWFSCIPVESVKRLGLPLPFFIRFDDVEYGLRTQEPPITLGGICLWHEPFENKYNEALEYYQVRNGLVVNALHRPRFTTYRAVVWMVHLFFGNIFRYRYSSFELTLKGIDDFLKGPDFFVHTPSDAYHQALMNMAVKCQPIDQLNIRFDPVEYQRSATQTDRALSKKILRMLLLNGAFFPARGETAVPAYKNAVASHFAKRRVLNCVGDTGLGFVAERSNMRALKLFGKFLGTCYKMIRNFSKVRGAFLERSTHLSSVEFWKRYHA